MGIVTITLFVLLSLTIKVQSASLQTEFLEQVEFSELETVLDTDLRNVLTEFHELRDGDVNFFLYTRENPHAVQLNDSNLNLVKPQRLTNFIVGGWIQNFRYNSMYANITDGYLRKGDYNIIIVDYYKLSFLPVNVAKSYGQPIGDVIAELIIKLQQQIKVSLKNITIVGHSLGGNVAGFAGRGVINRTGAKIARIIGLDASQFPFDPVNKNDAEIVELIHTTAVPGQIKPLGTVDFYPNGANYDLQPGCSLYPTKPFQNITDATKFILCGHHKSYEYFSLTINKIIKGVKCRSYEAFQEGKCKHNKLAIFGDNYVPGPQGSYYLYLNCSDTSCVSSYT